MLFPIGTSSFEILRNEGYVYVDKTDLIYQLTHTGRVYFLSRPRRFGKSLLLSTLDAYFNGRKDLFQGLAIEKLEQKWEEYIVLNLSFGGSEFSKLGRLESYLNIMLKGQERRFGITAESDEAGDRLAAIIKHTQEKSGLGVVVLIDEYDKPLLDTIGSTEKDEKGKSIEEHNKQILKSFYIVLKDYDRYLKFVMLTGITKFSQVSVFSGMNNLQDISLMRDFEALCGITEKELMSEFQQAIEKMAQENNMSYDKMLGALKKRYDGYHFSTLMTDIYNPFSLLSALKQRELSDYWFATGTPTYLIKILHGKHISVNEIAGREYTKRQFMDYKTEEYEQNILPLLYQSGYLTIKSFDQETELYTLDLPNDEVRVGFLSLVLDEYLQKGNETDQLCRVLTTSLKRNDLAKFFDQMTSFLASVPYTVRRKSTDKERESYFQLTFYLILRLLSNFLVSVEQVTSQGRIDCVVTTETDVYIFEFKLDGTVEEALAQIEAKGYGLQYATSGLTIHKVGVNFSSETGTVDSWGEGK